MQNTIFIRNFIILIVLILLSACTPSQVETGPAIKTYRYSSSTIEAAAISRDGELSLIAEQSGICLWNNKTHKKMMRCITGEQAEHIELIGISASKQYFYTSNQMSVRLYRLLKNSTATLVNEWYSDNNIINDIAISADGGTLVLGYRNGEASVVLQHSPTKQVFQQHRLDINTVALSSDGKLALTGSSDKVAQLWQTSDGKKLASLKHRTRVNHVDLSVDGDFAFTIDSINDRFISSVANTGMESVSELQTSLKFLEINDSAFSQDLRYFATASPKQKLMLWRVSDGELVGEWFAEQIGRSSVLQVAFINEKLLAIITSDGNYQEFTIKTVR